jgi:hypothetical protein
MKNIKNSSIKETNTHFVTKQKVKGKIRWINENILMRSEAVIMMDAY